MGGRGSVKKKAFIYRAVFRLCPLQHQVKTASNHCTANSTTISRGDKTHCDQCVLSDANQTSDRDESCGTEKSGRHDNANGQAGGLEGWMDFNDDEWKDIANEMRGQQYVQECRDARFAEMYRTPSIVQAEYFEWMMEAALFFTHA